MTGDGHYRIAEDLVLAATKPSSINPMVRILREVVSADVIAVAQVHATLALAAAVALGSRERDGGHDPDGMEPSDRHAWEAVASGGAR